MAAMPRRLSSAGTRPSMPGALEACRQSCQKCRLFRTTAFIGPRHISLSIQDSTSRPQTHRHWLALGFSFALTAVTLLFVFRGIRSQPFARVRATQDRGWLAVAAVFVLTQIFLGGERWRSILCALMRGPLPSM